MTPPTIAATLIVKNEAELLPDCLKSLEGKVEEIVVVDACSDDGTAEVALAAGAHVISRAWTGDFAAARNVALEAHSCDFALYIDADERLRLPLRGRVHDYVDPAHSFHLVRFQPRANFTRYGEWRIFRRASAIRFEGRIHETVMPAARRMNEKPVLTAVEIDHVGYDGPMDAKWRRNLPLLQRGVCEDPARAYLWLDLAECLWGIGDADAARWAVEEGIAAADRRANDEQRTAKSLLWLLSARMAIGQGRDPTPALEAGLDLRPDDYGLRYLFGQTQLDQSAPAEALITARTLAAIDPDKLVEGPLAFDRRIFLDGAAELEGLALLALGRRPEAAAAFARAARFSPQEMTHRLRCIALAGGEIDETTSDGD